MTTSKAKSEYMLLFRGGDWDNGLSPAELDTLMSDVMEWFQGLQAKGLVKGGQPLGPESKHLSGHKGRPVTVVDGPFAESKEAVGGFLHLELDSMEEAVEIARTCPTLEHGITVEIRPILDECPIFKRAMERQRAEGVLV